MTTRQEALDEVAALAARHHLTLDEIGARLNTAPLKGNSAFISRIFGYLGAALIFGGLGLLIDMQWKELGSAARVIITYGPGLAAFIMGIVTFKDPRYRNASTPLFLQSAILQPGGMFVFLHEYGGGDDKQLAALIVFSIVALQFLTAFFLTWRTTPLFFGYLFWNAAIGILMDRAGVPGDTLGLVLGFSILTTAWSLDRTKHRSIAGFWYLLGGMGLLWSVFDIVRHKPYDVFYLAIACAMMFVSVRMHSRTLLFVSTGALLGFLGYYTREHFANMVGWPVALMVMGALLVAISAYAVKLGQKISSGVTAPPSPAQ